MTGTKYEWAITPILAKRLVSNCDTNLLMTISTFEEVAVLSAVQSRCDLRRRCLHKSLVDHSFTTDRCGNNGDRTSQKFWKQRCSEQKRLKINGKCYKKHQKLNKARFLNIFIEKRASSCPQSLEESGLFSFALLTSEGENSQNVKRIFLRKVVI